MGFGDYYRRYYHMQLSRTAIYAFHLLILPVLVVIGYFGRSSPKWTFSFLLGTGIIGVLYHSFMLYSVYSSASGESRLGDPDP